MKSPAPLNGQLGSSLEFVDSLAFEMEHFRIRPLSESDIDEIIVAAGGGRAHSDAGRRDKPSADYLLGEALIELKALDEEGFEKSERQKKLAALFREHEKARPVIVLDRARLSEDARRTYDNIVEGPIKGAVRSAKKQLKQSRAECPAANASVLLIINNGYTTLDHDALLGMVARRVRDGTDGIDGIVVAGCYFYSDTFDSSFLWPINYVPINLCRPFASYEKLRAAWKDYANKFMTSVVRGQITTGKTKNPLADTQFNVDGVTYVKPAPPMGRGSGYFGNARPRKDSSRLTRCPPVATTFPDMTRGEWKKFHKALPDEESLFNKYEEWRADRAAAAVEATALKPFVPMVVTRNGWETWCTNRRIVKGMSSIRQYANELFEENIRAIMATARERLTSSFTPAHYVLAVTEEIGQDRANDVSHIAVVNELPNSKSAVRVLASDVRIFHEYALAVACAHAVAEGIESVLWQKDRRYAWT